MTIKRQAGLTLPSFWDEARLFINGQEFREGEEFFLLRGQPNQVRVEVSPDIAQQIRLELAEHNGLNLEASPDFGHWVDPVDDEFSWTITLGDGESGHITLVLFSREVELPWMLSCRVMSADLSDEVDGVWVDGAPYPVEGIVLFRDEPRTITLTYKPDSPVQDWPLELKATLLSGLEDGDLLVTLEGPHTWTIVAANNSGTFKLDLTGANFTSGITVPVSKVLSRNLADEGRVQIDGQDAVDGTVYFRGGVHTLTLVPKPGSPIAGHGVGLWLGRSPLVTSDPTAETFTVEHSWKITLATDRSGIFHFELVGEHFGRGNIKIDANILLSKDLADDASVLLDGEEMPPDGGDFLKGEARTITARWNIPEMVAVPLQLKVMPGPGLVEEDFTSVPPFEQLTTTCEWNVTATTLKSGVFKFQLSTDNDQALMQTPDHRLNALNAGSLRFRTLINTDYALPPQVIPVLVNTLFTSAVRLLNADGAPIVGATVTFHTPEYEGARSETDTRGMAFSNQVIVYKTVGQRTLRAVALLPEGNITTELLLGVIALESHTFK